MSDLIDLPQGGYRFVRGVFQYSAAVAALPGHRIARAMFPTPIPLDDGFATIAAYLQAQGRPLTALCACELRSPAPFDDQGFLDFNTRSAADPLLPCLQLHRRSHRRSALLRHRRQRRIH